MLRKVVLQGVSAAALIAPATVHAQDDQRSGASGRSREIVVTAQRREQLLTTVPLSIAAASGESLDARGIEGITDLKFETPGFISLSGTGFTQIYIRGVGNNIFVGADPSVATFIDDVPRVYGSLIDNLINVERVEVLKGAQGGLYGRNATGGVVNIVTRQPSDELSVQGEVSFGEVQSVDASAYINIPITDRVAANFSANRRVHDGFVKNLASSRPFAPGTTSFFGDPNSVTSAGPLNDADFWAVDGKIRIDLTDNLKVTLAGDYALKADADGNGWVQVEPERTSLVIRSFAAAAGISQPVLPFAVGSIEKRTSFSPIESFSRTEDFGFSGKVELALGGFDLISITAFRWNNGNFRGDLGAAPVPAAGFFTDFDRSNFYQELRAVSTGSGPLRFVAGATYYNDEIDNQIDGLFVGFKINETVAVTDTENYSIYGEVSYDITDRLNLTGSLRYVYEKKNAFFPSGGGAAGSVGEETASLNQDKLLPSATITYKVGDGIVYARYARGFKTGGINPIVRPSAFQGRPGAEFGPEVVDSFEVGYRASLFNRTVQVTTAAFYNDYSGVQIARAGNAANPTVSLAILNIGGAETYGAEASVAWQLTPNVSVSGNIGYLNAKYDRNAGFIGNPVVDAFSAGGNRMALSPKWQGGASIIVNQPINNSHRIKGAVLYSYVGRFNYQFEEKPQLFQSSYSIVNVRIGISDIDEHYGFFVFANNLFDSDFTTFGTTNSIGTLLNPGPPRVVGGKFEFRF